MFIALPKIPVALECEMQRRISLMSRITKILLRIIIMSQKQNQTRNSIGTVWLYDGKGTKNAICTLRTISIIEQALKVQKEVYLGSIDYTKALDRVRHDEIITQLTQMKINGKDL